MKIKAKKKIKKMNEKVIRVHLYPFGNILRPRGIMKKESVGLDIYERLMSAWREWTDSNYGDNPDEIELVHKLFYNLHEEVNQAWNKFIVTKGSQL